MLLRPHLAGTLTMAKTEDLDSCRYQVLEILNAAILMIRDDAVLFPLNQRAKALKFVVTKSLDLLKI